MPLGAQSALGNEQAPLNNAVGSAPSTWAIRTSCTLPIERLIDPAYIARRAAEVRLHEISRSAASSPGSPRDAHHPFFHPGRAG